MLKLVVIIIILILATIQAYKMSSQGDKNQNVRSKVAYYNSMSQPNSPIQTSDVIKQPNSPITKLSSTSSTLSTMSTASSLNNQKPITKRKVSIIGSGNWGSGIIMIIIIISSRNLLQHRHHHYHHDHHNRYH